MKIIEPSFEIIEQNDSLGLVGALKNIERIGRVCYKSESEITGDSYKGFVVMLENKGHGAMLEHGTVYLDLPRNPRLTAAKTSAFIFDFGDNKYSKVRYGNEKEYTREYVTTNYRVIYENNMLETVRPFVVPFSDNFERRASVKFICDRGLSHEFVRNRGRYGNAFAQESTRYCSYADDKFGKEITVIKPPFQGEWAEADEKVWESSMKQSEDAYMAMVESGLCPPQIARSVLPTCLKTELIITAMMSDWVHFFSLRADPAAHPSAQQLAYPLKEEFIRRGWIKK